MIVEKKTIRGMANELGIPKSTLHSNINKYIIKSNDYELIEKYCNLMEDNFKTKYLKGAESTKKKWKEVKNEKQKK